MTSDRSDATVFVDADNTLWDTDQVFAGAQLTMLAETELALELKAPPQDRLAFVRAIDQAIAARHHAGLRYPPRLLVRALSHALQGYGSEAAARAAWSGNIPAPLAGEAEAEIEMHFFTAVRQPPKLRSGVLDGLSQLQDAGATVLIVSESASAKVEASAATLGLAGYFTRVIEGQKRPELYHRVVRLTGSSTRAYMIGDQLDRDIAPAKQAGLTTIYFPGGFVPRWTPDEAKIDPDFRVSDFAEAAAIILSGRRSQKVRALGA